MYFKYIFLNFFVFLILPFNLYGQVDYNLLENNKWKLVHSFIYIKNIVPASLYSLSLKNGQGQVYDMRTNIFVPDLTFSNHKEEGMYNYHHKNDTITIDNSNNHYVLYCKNNCLIIYYFLDYKNKQSFAIQFDTYILKTKKENEIPLFKDAYYIIPFVKGLCSKMNLPFYVK